MMMPEVSMVTYRQMIDVIIEWYTHSVSIYFTLIGVEYR